MWAEDPPRKRLRTCSANWTPGLGAVGLARGHVFHLPLRQATIADVIGISAVHVQRVIANLKDAGLIVLQDRVLVIPDFASLAEMADFDETYLHLGNECGTHEQ